MPFNKSLFSSNKEEYKTPQCLFELLHKEFQFTLDAAASQTNTKCSQFYAREDDALAQDWPGHVWCNPPYGRNISRWVEKGYMESRKGSTVVMLLPSRTDTLWWHKWVMKAKEIRFLNQRLTFEGTNNKSPMPCSIIVFTSGNHKPIIGTVDIKSAMIHSSHSRRYA